MDRWFALYGTSSWTLAAVALVVANMVPLAGVLFLGWNVWTILIVYWLENGVVGVVNVFKMRRARGPFVPGTVSMTMNGRSVDGVAKAFLIPFFVLHYGIFWTVHGVFVITLPLFASIWPGQNGSMPFPSIWTIVLAIVALVVSHGLSYRLNYIGRGEYLRTSAARQMFAPYGRLVVLHITIIFGALAIGLTGAPVAAVAVLVVLKTVLDLGLHFAEHARSGLPEPT